MLEKVLKAWKCCDPFNRRCFECPYDADCFHDSFDRVAIADMAKLLKEQQQKIDGLLEDLATAIDDKESALMMLKEQQAEIDRLKGKQPIVRCKDCKKRYGYGCKFFLAMLGTEDDFYCKDGEPKDGDGE